MLAQRREAQSDARPPAEDEWAGDHSVFKIELDKLTLSADSALPFAQLPL